LGDLVCHEARLVVEADGDTHFDEDGKTKDALRTAFLEREGYRVLRFTNHEVITNLDGVAAAIRDTLTLTLPSLRDGPLPLPQRGEG
jgi:very-short-patch-repair endonuclease